MAKPIHEEFFTAAQADIFRKSVLGSSISARTEIRELSWNINPAAGLGDEGKERLSVCYTRQGDQWFPITHRIWQSGDKAFPAYLDKN